MTDETRIRICITNTMHDFRSCTHKDAHTPNCDGKRYAWNEKRNRDEYTGKPCTGCRPREARIGYLCLADHEKAQNALIEWSEFEPKIAAAEGRAVQRDNGGIAGQQIGYVPLPGTMLAVEEIHSYLKSFPGRLDYWVATQKGAMDAVRFARAVSSAIRTHAVEEKSIKLNRLRCPDCGTLSMIRNPPMIPNSDITVTCHNASCRKTIREHETTGGVEKLAVIADIESHGEKVPVAKIRTGGRDEFAEPYDPTRPEHADLDPLTFVPAPELRAMLDPETPRLKSMRRAELIEAIHEREPA